MQEENQRSDDEVRVQSPGVPSDPSEGSDIPTSTTPKASVDTPKAPVKVSALPVSPAVSETPENALDARLSPPVPKIFRLIADEGRAGRSSPHPLIPTEHDDSIFSFMDPPLKTLGSKDFWRRDSANHPILRRASDTSRKDALVIQSRGIRYEPAHACECCKPGLGPSVRYVPKKSQR